MQGAVESLNGFEEWAIGKHFTKRIEELSGTEIARALLFISYKRDGMNDHDAFQQAMLLPMKGLQDMFVLEADVEQGEAGGA